MSVLQIQIKQHHCLDAIVFYCSRKCGGYGQDKRGYGQDIAFSPADKTFHNCMSSLFGI